LSTIHGWHVLSSRPERLVIRSRVFELAEHFVDSKLRSCKCLGVDCLLCSLYPIQLSGCAAVSRESGGQIRLLRITPAAFKLLIENDDLEKLQIGRIIQCANLGRERREGLEITIGERIEAKEIFCSRYVQAIGQKAYNQVAGLFRSIDSRESLERRLATA
jgi:hypothetical protein